MKILIKNNDHILNIILKLNISYYIVFSTDKIIIEGKDLKKVNKALEKDYKEVLKLILSNSELTLKKFLI